jgi:hypothetical protein
MPHLLHAYRRAHRREAERARYLAHFEGTLTAQKRQPFEAKDKQDYRTPKEGVCGVSQDAGEEPQGYADSALRYRASELDGGGGGLASGLGFGLEVGCYLVDDFV